MAVLKIQEFIREHRNWEQLLEEPPYSLKIKRKGDLIMFNYNQYLSQPCDIVNEARGLILDEANDFKVIRYGFYRFYNVGEAGAAQVDFSKCIYEEKIDGTLVMFYWYNGKWHASTRATFDATDIDETELHCFAPLIAQAMKNTGVSTDDFDKDYTYVFELVSPESRVCVLYTGTALYYLMERNNITFEERYEPKPQYCCPCTWTFNSLKEAQKTLEGMRGDWFEGYVAREGTKRVKVKNLNWLELHHTINFFMSKTNMMDFIRNNDGDLDEILAYFPERKAAICEMRDKYHRLLEFARKLDAENYAERFPVKKDFVLYVQQFYPEEEWCIFFGAYQKRGESIVKNFSTNKLLRLLEMGEW